MAPSPHDIHHSGPHSPSIPDDESTDSAELRLIRESILRDGIDPDTLDIEDGPDTIRNVIPGWLFALVVFTHSRVVMQANQRIAILCTLN
jgi:hypothetical protein